MTPSTDMRHAGSVAGRCIGRTLCRLRRQRERGQNLVEMAFAIPILLVLVFGILEFAFILTNNIELSNAARDGARAGAVDYWSPSEKPSDWTTTSADDAVSAAQSSAGGLVSCTLQTPTASFAPDLGNNPQGIIVVSLSCPYQPLTPLGLLAKNLFGKTINTAFTLSASTERPVEP